MRRIGTALAAAALVTTGWLALVPGAASASATAPNCSSGASKFVCIANGGGAAITWTINYYQRGSGTPSTTVTTTPGNSWRGPCAAGSSAQVSYSYVSGGVTQTSPTSGVICSTGPIS